jgi:tripeptide aminopeptidase
VGRGTEHFDVESFGADFAYTVDGEAVGEIEDETFCADMATVTFTGKNVHPGYAKNKLVNSMKAAGRLLDSLPRDQAPETTEKREGYLHPISVSGDVERSVVRLIVRDFEESGLKRLEKALEGLVRQAAEAYPGIEEKLEIKEQYRNMKLHLDKEPRVVELAIEAVWRAGGKPSRAAIRGGTDGARLTYKGLLTPNIFTGGHEFHSRKEWISTRHMDFSVRTIVELIQLWHEKA